MCCDRYTVHVFLITVACETSQNSFFGLFMFDSFLSPSFSIFFVASPPIYRFSFRPHFLPFLSCCFGSSTPQLIHYNLLSGPLLNVKLSFLCFLDFWISVREFPFCLLSFHLFRISFKRNHFVCAETKKKRNETNFILICLLMQ